MPQRSAIGCERTESESIHVPDVQLQCANSYVIKIDSASWDIKSNTPCNVPARARRSTASDCKPKSKNVKSKIRKICDGETVCSIEPTADFFNTKACRKSRVLEIEFSCVLPKSQEGSGSSEESGGDSKKSKSKSKESSSEEDAD